MRVNHLITGEYPPKIGGVSAYSRHVARGLTELSGQPLHIWTPASCGVGELDPLITVHHLVGHFNPYSLALLRRGIGNADPGAILVQYVPHAYGFKAMNLPFCAWLLAMARSGYDIVVMFHEVAFPFLPGQSKRHRLLAIITRLMANLVVQSARVIFVSTLSWKPRLEAVSSRKIEVQSLPTFSNIPVIEDDYAIQAARRRYSNGGYLLGHFCSSSDQISNLIKSVTSSILNQNDNVAVLLIGMMSRQLRSDITIAYPHLKGLVHASGPLPEHELSICISACDLTMQPYPDGICTRRTTTMAALAHSRVVVTTAGEMTESIWTESGAVALAPTFDSEAFGSLTEKLLSDTNSRIRLAVAGKKLYEERFSLRNTIAKIRSTHM